MPRCQYNLASAAIDRYPEEEEALMGRVADFLETDTVWYVCACCAVTWRVV